MTDSGSKIKMNKDEKNKENTSLIYKYYRNFQKTIHK